MKNSQAKQQKKALQVLKKHERKLKKYEGVYDVALGYPIHKKNIDFNELSILVYIHKKKAKSRLKSNELLPVELDGIPVDVIQSKPKEHSMTDFLDGKHNPLVGGIFVANGNLKGGGTLGMIVRQEQTGEALGLTNWHVIKKRKGRRGNPIIQPAWKPNTTEYRVGNLYRWNKKLDCAVFTLNGARKHNSASTFFNIQGKVKSMQTPFIGMQVMKSGGKTGVTYGIVSSVSSDQVRIRIVPNPTKQAQGNEISDSGDSGAVWITDEVKKKAVALHWGGDKSTAHGTEFAMANNLKKIFEVLELRF